MGERLDAKYFLVTSHGRTATYWLASRLNAHPDVLCSHGPVLPPFLAYQTQPPDELALYAHETAGAFLQKTLDEVFEALEEAGPARVYGNVHGYSAHELFTMPHLVPQGRLPVVFNLVRHPVTRVESLKRRLLHEIRFSPHAQQRLTGGFDAFVDRDVLRNLARHCEVDHTLPDNRAFLYSACYIPSLDMLDFRTRVAHIPMERVTGDAAYFTWLFGQLTQGAATLTAG